jgi:acyl carrier protein
MASPTSVSVEGVDEQALVDWLIAAVARYARVAPSTVTAQTGFQEVGLSSLAAVMLSGELCDHFGIDVDPLVTWDYPTIAEVAHAIAHGLVGAPRAPEG